MHEQSQATQFDFFRCDAYRHCICFRWQVLHGGMHIITIIVHGTFATCWPAYTLSSCKGQSWIQYQGQMVSCPAFPPFVFLIHTCLPYSHLRLCCPPRTSCFRSLRQLLAPESESFTCLHTACLCSMSSCVRLLYVQRPCKSSSPGFMPGP